MQPVTPQAGASFLDRFVGVLKLDPATWQGIKQDAAANQQALLIVLGAGLISGLTAARGLALSVQEFQTQLEQTAIEDPELAAELGQLDVSMFDSGGARVSMVIFSIIGSLIAWYIFAALSRWAAGQFFGADPNAATSGQMRRLTGWAYAPALLNILAPIPVVGGIVSIVAVIWVLVNQVHAIKTGMNLTTGKSVGAMIVANIMPAIIIGLLICACLAVVAMVGGVTSP
jgi:hypothetical protein